MSITFIAGTTAELIKVSPVMRELSQMEQPYLLWSTSQHVTGVDESLAGLDVRRPDRYLLEEHARAHIAASRQVPGWSLRLLSTVVRHRRELKRAARGDGRRGVVVVHGDTFSTVLGALIGRFLGADVAHIEAGLRSGSLLNPFPEEINRRVVGRLAGIHFAPTAREGDTLRRAGAPGRYVETGANTVVDALRQAAQEHPDDLELPEHFGLVTLHRFELLRQAETFTGILETLSSRTDDLPLVMVAGQAERERIRSLGLEGLFGERFLLIDKRPYARFLPILLQADFVVTDSGGLQEECAVLGIPCAVHRERTERHQGLGENVVLTEMDQGVLEEFLDSWRDYRMPSTLGRYHPSRIIAAELVDHLSR